MFTIRPVQASDNKYIANIIRQCLLEFNAAKPGTMFFDPTLESTFEYFQKEKCGYFVAEMGGKIVGGGGYYPTKELLDGIVELVRLYLTPPARGKGLGKFIIQHCESEAKAAGYKQIYLETTAELTMAIPLYEKLGYRYTEQPMGDSGHFGCEIRMLKTL